MQVVTARFLLILTICCASVTPGLTQSQESTLRPQLRPDPALVAKRDATLRPKLRPLYITELRPQEKLRPKSRPRPFNMALTAMRRGNWAAAKRLAAEDGQVAEDIITWHYLREGHGEFRQVQAFLARNPTWPGLKLLRRRSEPAVLKATVPDVLSFFETHPAQSALGILGHAVSLAQTGARDAADALIVETWRTRRLSDANHALFLAAHKDLLRTHHVARLEEMLWHGWIKDARRAVPWVSDDHAALAEAWIALRLKDGGVDTRLEAVPDALRSHPGLIHARFEWRIQKGRWEEAKEIILAQSASAAKLGKPSAWSNRRRQLARDEMRDGSAARAYQIAARHHLEPGPHYADLEWLAGYIALTRLDDPALALTHFERHDAAVVSPISQGRAGYWKGRAHRALGNEAAALQEFQMGAQNQTAFYGLLAAEAIGAPFDVGLDAVPQSDWQQAPFMQSSLFEAGLLLIAAKEKNLAERFLVQLAEDLDARETALLGQAVIDLGEPHIAVMVGKTAARRGEIVPMPYYPLHPMISAQMATPTDMALAIARRESEFDPVVVTGRFGTMAVDAGLAEIGYVLEADRIVPYEF